MTYTPEHLTNLLTTDREKLTRICAEVCYGNYEPIADGVLVIIGHRLIRFEPLEKTHIGRSQAFELAVKFQLGSSFHENGCWSVHDNTGELLVDEIPDLQDAYLVGAILTAQQENNDE